MKTSRNLSAVSCFSIAFAICLLQATTYAQEPVQYPLSIAVSGSKIMLADRNMHGVWELKEGNPIAYFTGSNKFRTPMNAIRCVEFDSDGKLLAGDSSTREVYRFDDDGKPVPLTNGGIGIAMDIAVNKAGDLFVTDLEIQRVMKVPKEGGKPEEVTEISGCRGLFVDKEDHLWVVSTTNNQLYRISPDGKSETIVEGRAFEFPHTVVVDDDLTAYVCDGYAKTIWKIPRGGKPEAWVKGEPMVNPVGMAIQGDTIYVVDPRAVAVFEIDREGKLKTIPLKPAGPAKAPKKKDAS
jgi:sugar lactone lactonase YvrE